MIGVRAGAADFRPRGRFVTMRRRRCNARAPGTRRRAVCLFIS